MKGGSLASDSVANLISTNQYSEMDNNFDNVLSGGAKKKTRKPKKKTTKKGGSIASDSVISHVSPSAFTKMDANFDNTAKSSPLAVGGAKKKKKKTTKKGGSIASDSVISHVDPSAFTKMDANFDNTVLSGGKKPKPKAKKPKVSKKGGAEDSVWTQVMNDFAQHFTQEHFLANGGKKKYKPKAKKPIIAKGGNFGKNLSEYMASDGNSSINIFNKKKGGACANITTQSPIGLDYSSIPHSSSSGHPNPVMTNEVLNAITDASITGSSVQSMAKTVNYGNFTNAGITTPFNYGTYGTISGGGKKKITKVTKKSKSTKK
jgi:hypothetical protein